MNGKRLQNLAGLFRSARTRTIIIFTAVILGFAVLVGVIRLFSETSGPPATSTVRGTGFIQSIPGGFDRPETKEYASLQEQQNVAEAKIAEKRGTSAIPTIIRSGAFDQPTQPGCCQPCPCPPGGAAGVAATLLHPTMLTPGTLAYDSQGHVIGTIGPDGKVRDAEGRVIGTVGPDGLIRDAAGNVIGSAGNIAAGTPVYDSQGKLIGTVGPDGKVRDAEGRVIGTVGPDGVVRDTSGNIIGKAGSIPSGTPVYDSKGRLIGTVGPHGQVRDASGKVIGTLGSDGLVRDAQGKVIGKAGAIKSGVQPGTPVYDSKGRLIGTVGPDGKVYDANGKQIGTLGPDGLVRDASGRVIGKAGTVVAGTPVYDDQGRLIGTVGPDGKVRDADGNVIGTVGPNGTVRDANGKIIGKTGPTIAGTPAYDAQGRLMGVVGPDGKVRDANGRVLGTVGMDGVVRSPGGNIIGSTTPPGAPSLTPTTLPSTGIPGVSALPQAESSEREAALKSQAQILSQQQAAQLRQQLQAGMATQANQLLAAWAPPSPAYVVGNPPEPPKVAAVTPQACPADEDCECPAGETCPPGTGVGKGNGAVVKAGTIMYAVLLTSVNTDNPGPVLAHIVEGKFKGGRLIGSITNEGDKVMLSFNTMTLPYVSHSISINSVAIDQCTAHTALSDYTNHHYLLRYGSLFASSFLQGYAQALSQSGATVVSTGLATSTSYPSLSPGGKFMVALGNVGNRYSAIVGDIFNTPPTVHVYSGTAVGILFLKDVPPFSKKTLSEKLNTTSPPNPAASPPTGRVG